MRAREFILLEYRRDITIQKMGDKLFDAFVRMDSKNADTQFRQIKLIITKSIKKLLGGTGYSTMVFGKQVNIPANDLENLVNYVKEPVVNELVDYFEDRDPTPNKKFAQWMIRVFINNPNSVRMEDYNRADMLGLYERGKQFGIITPTSSGGRRNDADINSFPEYKIFEATMHAFYAADIMSRMEQTSSNDRGEFEVVYEDDDVRVIHPKDETAACYYGRGTRWCTASTRGTNHFERYNKDGPLYILLPKKPMYEGEKYQIHVESRQFMDENDEGVGLSNIMDRFPGFVSWAVDNIEIFSHIIKLMPDELLSKIMAEINTILSVKIDRMVQDLENSSSEFADWQGDYARELGYVDSEGQVDWDRVNDDPRFSFFEFNEQAGEFNSLKDDIDRITVEDLRLAAEEYERNNSDLVYIDEISYVYRQLINNEFSPSRPGKIYQDLVGELNPWMYHNITVTAVKPGILPMDKMLKQMQDKGYVKVDGWWVGRMPEMGDHFIDYQ